MDGIEVKYRKNKAQASQIYYQSHSDVTLR